MKRRDRLEIVSATLDYLYPYIKNEVYRVDELEKRIKAIEEAFEILKVALEAKVVNAPTPR